MKYLFIDTNVLLNFFRLSSDALEELEKLVAAIKKAEIALILNKQSWDEFWRRREEVIAESIKSFSEAPVPNKFPIILQQYDEFSELTDALKAAQKAKEKLVNNLKKDVADQSTQADKLIDDIFSNSDILPLSDAILTASRLRIERGNPPGKKNSIGDAIHWEFMLNCVPEGEDLFLVTNDSDFISAVDKDQISQFLKAEWEALKKSQVHRYKTLSSFFSSQYSEIKLAEDFEKVGYISQLVNSNSFATTHSAIASLLSYDNFSDTQAKRMIEAALENNQIRWILHDDDVYSFYGQLITSKKSNIDDNLLASFQKVFAPDDSAADEIPF